MRKSFLLFSLFLIAFLGSFFIYHKTALARNAPAVQFVDGDDINLNGGTDDPYDSLIVFEIDTQEPGLTGYEIEYSSDGFSWTALDVTNMLARHEIVRIAGNHYRVYWSTSLIPYSPTLWFKALSHHTDGDSDWYQTNELSILHRNTSYSSNFFVEDFTTTDFKYTHPDLKLDWNNNFSGLLELRWLGNKYQRPGYARSLNLLSPDNVATITSVTFQPVQVEDNDFFTGTIGYKISNDGTTWYPAGNDWYYFPAGVVPPALEYNFPTYNNELYFGVRMDSDNDNYSPRAYQLRFQYTEDSSPQACFTVNPVSDFIDPDRSFAFDASCSGDLEDALSNLNFKWDWQSDGQWDLDGSSYQPAHNFHSTSTFTTTLHIEDSVGGWDEYKFAINQESAPGEIYGWLWGAHNTATQGYGWTSLNCNNIYYGSQHNYCGSSNYGLSTDANSNISGWAWNPYLGWLCFGSSCQSYGATPEGIPPYANFSNVDGTVNGWGKFISQGNVGWLSLRYGLPNCASQDYHRVELDLNNRTINGFAWAGGKDASQDYIGPGWQGFGGYITLPWLETLYGSVYGRSGLGNDQTFSPPPDHYSASYCILSGGDITNFNSQIGCQQESYSTFDFPSAPNQYRNILGVLDLDGIIAGATGVISSDIDGNLPNVLGDNAYYFTGSADYYIDQPFIVYNARNLNSSGAGTVVVNGNLHINKDFYYEEAVVTGQIKNLASLSWIVLGDVIIDPSVSNVVGSFVILGQNGENGSLLTGNDLNSPKQLLISGLVMASHFDFQRQYRSNNEPAERIVYDGRVLVSPPPGFSDFNKALPVWQESLATTGID